MGRRIIVTGGGTGIGRATAHRLLPGCSELVLIGRRAEVLDTAARRLRDDAEDGTEVTTAGCDLTDPGQVQDLADRLLDGPRIDVLVANAGGNAGHSAGSGLAATAAAWRADFEGNVLTAVLLTQALLPHLSRPGGRVVAMSSIAALRGSGSYGGAKAALNAWVLSLATTVAADGITVNAVAPGFVPETPFWEDRLAADPDLLDSRIQPIPMGRPGTVEEIAAAVAYLASADAGWTTGQILQVNGGTLLGRG